MTTQETANAFVAMLKQGQFAEAGEAFWADDIVSIEPMGDQTHASGKAAVRAKGEWWYANHEVHAAEAHGPYVAHDQFAVCFTLDVTPKASGQRMKMDEVGLYTVRDGKIVEEKFLYGGMG